MLELQTGILHTILGILGLDEFEIVGPLRKGIEHIYKTVAQPPQHVAQPHRGHRRGRALRLAAKPHIHAGKFAQALPPIVGGI